MKPASGYLQDRSIRSSYCWISHKSNVNRLTSHPGTQEHASISKRVERFLLNTLMGAFAFSTLMADVPLHAESPSTGSWLEGLTIFGNARLRPEFRSNSDFNRDTNDTPEYVGSRIQLGIDKQISKYTRVVIRIQDSRVWGSSPGSDNGFATASDLSQESLDLREGYIRSDNLLGPVGMTIGRQMLDYGSGRQIGKLGWSNVGRSFDALEFHWDLGFWKASLAGAVLAEEDSDGGGNATHVGRSNPSGISFQCNATSGLCSVRASTARELDDAYLAVFYNTFKLHPQFQFEPYYIGRFKKWIPASTSPYPGLPVPPKARDRQRDNLHTVGFRITNRTVDGKSPGPLDYSLEAAFQTGFNGQRVQAGWDVLNLRDTSGDPLYTERQVYEAHAIYGELGYRITELLHVGVAGDLATGDPDRSDATVATYTQLYPTNHGPMGDMDLVGSRNLIARAVTLKFFLEKFGKIKLSYWHYSKHKNQDSYYGNGGAPVRDANGDLLSTESENNARFASTLNADGTIQEFSSAQLGSQLFHEYNLTYSVEVNNMDFSLGYGQAHALSSIRNRVDQVFVSADVRNPAFDPRADFAYVMLSARF